MHRTWISTNIFGKAFLAKAWEARTALLDYERRGFAQFFYLTICGHTEAVLVEIIKRRLHSIEFSICWDALPPMKHTFNGVSHSYPVTSVVDSIRRILAKFRSGMETATLSKLIEIYGVIFSKRLLDVIGDENYQDLTALMDLRNLFAHGRDLIMEFTAKEPENEYIGTLDNNPLEKPARRLYRAGIIKNFEINGQNYNEFQALFFSDQSMMYFYKAVQVIEEQIRLETAFPPEKTGPTNPPLPDLHI